MHKTRLAVVLYVLVQTASRVKYKILEARNRAALSCANTKGLHNDCNNISGRWKEFASWPGIATSIHPYTSVGKLKKQKMLFYILEWRRGTCPWFAP